MTTEYFGSFVADVAPKDVFVAATVNQGDNVINACKSLGIPTLLCRAHHLNSAVMWMLGIAGSASTCKNKEMKDAIQKAAALAGVFSHSAVNNDALQAVEGEMQEENMKELAEMAAEAEKMEVLRDEADLGAARFGSSGAPSADSRNSAFDTNNLPRRNDTR